MFVSCTTERKYVTVRHTVDHTLTLFIDAEAHKAMHTRQDLGSASLMNIYMEMGARPERQTLNFQFGRTSMAENRSTECTHLDFKIYVFFGSSFVNFPSHTCRKWIKSFLLCVRPDVLCANWHTKQQHKDIMSREPWAMSSSYIRRHECDKMIKMSSIWWKQDVMESNRCYCLRRAQSHCHAVSEIAIWRRPKNDDDMLSVCDCKTASVAVDTATETPHIESWLKSSEQTTESIWWNRLQCHDNIKTINTSFNQILHRNEIKWDASEMTMF